MPLMDKEKLMKIIIPVLMIIVVAGIWFYKNSNTDTYDEGFAFEVTSVDLDDLASYELPIIIDFGADSCAPCKEMEPVLIAINAEMQGKAIIRFVDVWKNSKAADGFPVQVIPTQLFINADGTPYVPSEDMGIEFTMYSYQDTGEHAFTVHQGGLNEEQMREILADMGVDE